MTPTLTPEQQQKVSSLRELLTRAEEAGGERPMWCDDFDMDLPKVVPQARKIIGDVAGIEMWTFGTTTHGTLNHPSVWNGDRGLEAHFGLRGARRPAHYYTNCGIVKCTFWEAVRDAWAHQYLMLVDGHPILDAQLLWRPFETIMWDVRGWGEPRPRRVSRAKATVRQCLTSSAALLRSLLAQAEGGEK